MKLTFELFNRNGEHNKTQAFYCMLRLAYISISMNSLIIQANIESYIYMSLEIFTGIYNIICRKCMPYLYEHYGFRSTVILSSTNRVRVIHDSCSVRDGYSYEARQSVRLYVDKFSQPPRRVYFHVDQP